MVTAAVKLKDACSLEGKLWQTSTAYEKNKRYHFANKGLHSQSYCFSSNHVWMWVGLQKRLSNQELVLLNCGAGELLRVLWTARKSNQSILKEINPEYSLEGLRLKLKLPILWPPDVKSQLTGKDADAGKDWRQNEKWAAEDEMVTKHRSPTQWTRVWANSRRQRRTEQPGVLQPMGSQRVRLTDWKTTSPSCEINPLPGTAVLEDFDLFLNN